MIILGIAICHNSSASLMINGELKGIIQEERLTRIKNQAGFPLLAVKSLINHHLNGDFNAIDVVVAGSKFYDPYYYCIAKYTNYDVEDHIKEMKEVWYPHFYKNKAFNDAVWKKNFLNKHRLNKYHNFDFSFIKKDTSHADAIKFFSDVELFNPVKKILGSGIEYEKLDHHNCHAYYALYGGKLSDNKIKDTLILTADAMGDLRNWTVSIVKEDGELNELASGNNFLVARIYKFITLILGMKPLEHEYKVMGLSAYSNSKKHIEKVEEVFFEILDFKEGDFYSISPLKDSYFDLKKRLEGFRFDNIAAALQNWTSKVLIKWAEYWLKVTNKKGIAFSGGLSMNIKANGDLLQSKMVEWLSVPASGGDESLSAGACFLKAKSNKQKVFSISSPYLGDEAKFKDEEIFDRLVDTKYKKEDFIVIDNFDNSKIAKLLLKDNIIARCVGRSEFGARALGNRSILANPKNQNNVKIINDNVKSRDFWMPFTPSILEEKTDLFLNNNKKNSSPYMTIGYKTKDIARLKIPATLHMADFSARPQFVSKLTNPNYWNLINEFYKLSDIPCLLNTSLNIHGEPMNYSVSDAVRTLAISNMDFLALPNNMLMLKKKAKEKIITYFNIDL